MPQKHGDGAPFPPRTQGHHPWPNTRQVGTRPLGPDPEPTHRRHVHWPEDSYLDRPMGRAGRQWPPITGFPGNDQHGRYPVNNRPGPGGEDPLVIHSTTRTDWVDQGTGYHEGGNFTGPMPQSTWTANHQAQQQGPQAETQSTMRQDGAQESAGNQWHSENGPAQNQGQFSEDNWEGQANAGVASLRSPGNGPPNQGHGNFGDNQLSRSLKYSLS